MKKIQKKNKKIIKKIRQNIPGFIIGVLICGTISVYAVTYFPSKDTTYDNSNSGLESTNVQGAIDELYNTCFPSTPAGNQILENTDVVTSGDGLYKDENEDRYFYRGTNPNNYVTFNDETAGWRIISLEADGTIKIMKNASIGRQYWDTAGKNTWSTASLQTYLNSTYYISLNSVAQSQIVSKDFSIGAITDENDNLSEQITNENSSKWNGKVALPTVSEYLRTSSNQNQCGTIYRLLHFTRQCIQSFWMPMNDWWWTITTKNINGHYAFFIGGGQVGNQVTDGSALGANENNIYPVVYLSKDIKITGGNGSQSNPYTIE